MCARKWTSEYPDFFLLFFNLNTHSFCMCANGQCELKDGCQTEDGGVRGGP